MAYLSAATLLCIAGAALTALGGVLWRRGNGS